MFRSIERNLSKIGRRRRREFGAHRSRVFKFRASGLSLDCCAGSSRYSGEDWFYFCLYFALNQYSCSTKITGKQSTNSVQAALPFARRLCYSMYERYDWTFCFNDQPNPCTHTNTHAYTHTYTHTHTHTCTHAHTHVVVNLAQPSHSPKAHLALGPPKYPPEGPCSADAWPRLPSHCTYRFWSPLHAGFQPLHAAVTAAAPYEPAWYQKWCRRSLRADTAELRLFIERARLLTKVQKLKHESTTQHLKIAANRLYNSLSSTSAWMHTHQHTLQVHGNITTRPHGLYALCLCMPGLCT